MTTSADCNCAGDPSPSPTSFERAGTSTRVRAGSWLGLLAGLAGVLAPKCPMCLAAYLSAVGVGVGVAQPASRVAPILLPMGIVIASVAFVALAINRTNRTRRRP